VGTVRLVIGSSGPHLRPHPRILRLGQRERPETAIDREFDVLYRISRER